MAERPGVISTHYGHLIGREVPDCDELDGTDNFGRRNVRELSSTYPQPRKGR
jgi:hypothetical protein